MREKITVLITGGGSPGIAGTIYSLRKNPDNVDVRIVTCDMRDNVVGKYLADAFYVVPQAQDSGFIKAVLEICEKEDVDVILPQVTSELNVFARFKETLKLQGVRVAVSDTSSIEMANDKWVILGTANACGVPIPHSKLTSSEDEFVKAVLELGYPKCKVVVKPRVSNGSRGLRILSSESWDVERFLKEKPDGTEINLEGLLQILRNGKWPDLIVQEYLPGEEYTVDVFRGNRGTLAIPRLREEIRGGITFKAKVELRKDLIGFATKLSEALDLKYAFGFQFKTSSEGTPKLLECNPRIQGTMVVSTLAGYNMIWWTIKELLEENFEVPLLEKNSERMRFVRYWGGVGFFEDGTKIGPIC